MPLPLGGNTRAKINVKEKDSYSAFCGNEPCFHQWAGASELAELETGSATHESAGICATPG